MPYKIPESVLVILHTPSLNVLVLERADRPGFWQSVTGSKAHWGEPLWQTCVREVKEETGVTIDAAALIDWEQQNRYEIYQLWRYRYEPGVTHNTEHVFSCCVPEDTAVVISPREHLRFEWLEQDRAARRCFSPSNVEAIEQLHRRFTA
ncbi:MAG: dihydroneopterin triphosphate diphosphatase [Betaproteobacteria bacterium]|nr:dihydroneopterin triphosphate diphosphatase [Pseudomonadota bacterium]NBO12216.1 dihydroneopterin triphosphate diphosphatase [Betaproteobacteria bacterium]NBO43164.1 dihydroneopterin triphosphate diphosphatase [Betaproteobacteria bacterium]NBP09424.1 dihydroneopterin triphosphate diphosphatase [Betaproteobacteria bacterium]NBP60747.1 dihydroneopterin triphosphate diphosphatase [Betaproteobacteria bacterium]